MSSGVVFPRVRALDGVRGLAVAAVLLFHSDLLEGGYLGVDLFFVLSGYLITSLLLLEAQTTSGVKLLAFWARRARRLLPAIFVVLLGVAVYAAVIAEPSELARIRGDGFATLGYFANWRSILANVDYWALFKKPSPLEHTWSLAIEEQFYIVWPLVVLGVLAWSRRRGDVAGVARRMFVASGALALAGAGWALWLWTASHDSNRIYLGTDTRASSILFGATFAAWICWRGPVRSDRGRKLLEIVGLGGAAVLAVAWTQLNGDVLFRGGLLACSLAALAVIAAASHPRPGVVARALAFRPFVALGIISYGVYLWHWPLYLVLDSTRTGLDGWTLFGLRLVVTLTVATVSYVLVERPVRRGAGSPARVRVVTPVLAGALILVLLVTTAGAKDFTPDRQVFPDPARAARRAEREGARRIMVGGNSVASVLAQEGFKAVKTRTPIVVLDDGVYSCDFPVPQIRIADNSDPLTPVDCTTPWRSAIDKFDPEIVVLIFGDVHITEYKFADGWASQCDAPFAPNYRATLDRAIERLSARGARVVLTTAAYSTFVLPRSYNNTVRAGTKCTNTILREYALSHPDVGFVDLNAFMCPRGDVCRRQIDGENVRPDGVHYRGRGAQVVASWILNQIGIESRASS